MSRIYLSQAGPLHPKHGGGKRPPELYMNSNHLVPPLHPTLAFITHYTIAIPSIFLLHDAFFDIDVNDSNWNRPDIRQRQDKIAQFTFVYVMILFGARYLSSYIAGSLRKHAVLYELTWMCNSTLVMGFICFGGLGNVLQNIDADIMLMKHPFLAWLCQRRPLVVTACCVGVSIDQVLWYVDLSGRILTGKFPIGVAKYLTWKQTLWIDRLTCTHHLWTIPLFLYGAGGMQSHSFALSVCIVAIQVVLSRWLTPHHIEVVSSDICQQNNQLDPTTYRYLNVNLSHELWQDISFSFLQISKDNPHCLVYIFRLLWRWQILNWIMFQVVLRPVSTLMKN